MTKFLSYKSLIFLNGVQFLTRGKLHPEYTYATAKSLYNLNMEFTNDKGETVSFSDDPDNDMHIDKVLQNYDRYREENPIVPKTKTK